MRLARLLTAVSAFLFLGVGVASANTISVSTDRSQSYGPFVFYCQPYTRPFQTDYHYKPDGSTCTFSLPYTMDSHTKLVAIYKGVPGNSVRFINDRISQADISTLVQLGSIPFLAQNPAEETDFFGAVIDYSDENLGDAIDSYLQNGGTLPPGALKNQNFAYVAWKWGDKPPSEYDPVIIIPGILGSWQKNGKWVIDPILHTYDNLIGTFLANGYVENKTLFTFPYDWEEPNQISAHILASKIQSVKQICGCSKVDIVAHSMGGLIALYYIENVDYKNDVDQLFLVATPLSGSPKAYKTWEAGIMDFGDPRKNLVMQTEFHLEARKHGFPSVFDYIQKKPIESVRQLLPIYNYLSTATTTLIYPNGYPVNGFLEGLRRQLETALTPGVEYNVILADDKQNDTVGGFVVKPSTQLPKWQHGEPIQTLFTAGDGTVPRASIEKIASVDKEYDDTNHSSAASSSAPYIFNKLNFKNPSIIIGKDYNANVSLLFVSLFSPIDMQIVAPDGKRLGKNFSNNSELNEMPDAFYSGFDTDDEYAVIVDPLPGNYKVETRGTGSGNFTIVTNYVNSSTSTEAEISGAATLGQVNTFSILAPTSTPAITIQDTTSQTLTPETCIADITKAFQTKWITKKAVADGLLFDCKSLKTLFAAKSKTPGNQPLPILTLIRVTLDHMDLLAMDRSNTKDAVELIHKYTAWFKNQYL
jgi:pimeloyl-ACP methyl ester carboxylesterase